ncbi:MAG: hypothetical protein FJX72_00095 [Armatimonadetes bacterium]|nr:hypothetical protein [Armatimonadota bacterium]
MQPNYDTRICHRRRRGYLPHWEGPGAAYLVTFRLADSLPVSVLRALERERDEALRSIGIERTEEADAARQTVLDRYGERLDEYLDCAAGCCLLREPAYAQIVADALTFFDGVRYGLRAWRVMPNHGYAVVTPLGDVRLSAVVHSWKSYTAHRIREVLGGPGAVWQREYYDRLVRDERELTRWVGYVVGNPGRAGLEPWPWVSPCGGGR